MWGFLLIPLFIGLFIFLKKDIKKEKREKIEEIGEQGENTVAGILERIKSNKSYLLNNVILLDYNGESYQIDHIFISQNGIWVIETKNHAGKIYGSDQRKNWIQVLNYGTFKNSFYSPVKQNLAHAHKIAKVIKKKSKIIPLVVFVSADIKDVDSKYICHINNLIEVISGYYGVDLTQEEIEECYEEIVSRQKKCKVTNEQHIHQQEQKKKEIRKKICPRCGKRLIKRKGKNGKFYGCSSFPKCRFTINKIK